MRYRQDDMLIGNSVR